MAATYTIAGIALGPNGPVNGATCNAWKAQRFSSAPSQDSSAPSGSADAGPVTSGITYGGVGAYSLQCPTNESYYVAIQYGGHTYWQFINDVNFTDEVETTVASGSNGQQIGSLTSNQLSVASTTGFNASGRVNVTASGGQAILAYTGTSGGNLLTGITVVSGTGTWTVSTGAAVTQTQQLTTLNQTVDDGSGNETVAGNLTVNGRLILNGNTAFGVHTTGAFTTTNTAGVAVTSLAFNIAASEVMYFEATILASSASAGVTYGSKYSVSAPTGATGFFTVSGPVVSATTTAAQTTETTLSTLCGPFAETSTAVMLTITGIVINGTTAGTVGLNIAAATTTSTVTVGTGSNILAFQIS